MVVDGLPSVDIGTTEGVDAVPCTLYTYCTVSCNNTVYLLTLPYMFLYRVYLNKERSSLKIYTRYCILHLIKNHYMSVLIYCMEVEQAGT